MPKLLQLSFLFSGRLGRGGLRLILLDYFITKNQTATQLYCYIHSNSVLQLYSFDSGYSLVFIGKDLLSGERIRNYIFFFFFNHSFPFFYYHKINLHVGISTFEQLFSLCFLKYESFSNCQQSYYRNIYYFGEIYTCENLTFHLHSEKRCKICELDGVYKKCINSLKIAIIIYRCIRNSTSMNLTHEIEHYMQQWNYITIRQAKTKQNRFFMFCSDMGELLIVTDCHELLKNYTKFNKI